MKCFILAVTILIGPIPRRSIRHAELSLLQTCPRGATDCVSSWDYSQVSICHIKLKLASTKKQSVLENRADLPP